MPLCANNKVSRAGLHTQPAKIIAPLFARVPPPPPEQAQVAVKAAQESVDQAKDRVENASRGQLKELLRSAQREVDKARRTPGARRELRELESQFEKLKRDAKKREGVIDDEERQDRLKQTAAISAPIDRLAPMNLGMGSGRAMPPPSDPGDTKERGASSAVTSAIHNAEEALSRAESGTLQELGAAKSAAQKAQAAAKKAGASDADLRQLGELVKRLQRAESRMRIQAASEAARESVVLREELAFLRTPNLDLKANRQKTGDFSEAVAAGFIQLFLDHDLLSQHNPGDKPQGLDIVAVDQRDNVVFYEVKGTARSGSPNPHTSSTKTGHQGGATWAESRSQEGPVQLSSTTQVGEAPDQVANRLIRVDIAAGEIAVLALDRDGRPVTIVDANGRPAYQAEITASLDEVVSAIDNS